MALDSQNETMKISQMELGNLQQEPHRLSAESERLNQELESLVMDNYRVFVENLTCSAHLRTEDKKLGESIYLLSEKLQGLSSQCVTFRDRVNHFVNSHKRNRKTLQHHMQLVELLEVPQLVDACARNGFHEEALELANFVNGLERRHLLAAEVRSVDGKCRGGSGVVQSIVDDVHNTLVGLRSQLLHLLTENASLPKELQILATLRKLDSLLIDRQLALERHENDTLTSMNDKQRDILRHHFLRCSETRLQMDFLEARSVWLLKVIDKALHGTSSVDISMVDALHSTSSIQENEKSKVNNPGNCLGPYGKAIEMLEVNRTSWFSVVTQFNALFEDNIDGSHPGSAILGAWVSKQIHQLLLQLQQILPSIDEGASLRSVLEQALFFASRMGAVGCDFTNLLLPLFKSVLINRLSMEWKVASSQFKNIITTERFVIETDDITREQLVPLYLTPDDSASPLSSLQEECSRANSAEDTSLAPSHLLIFPPLAYLLNSLLSTFNFLRECPIMSAREALLMEFELVMTDLLQYFANISSDLKSRGSRYLLTKAGREKQVVGNKDPGNFPSKQGLPHVTMDKLYATALAQDFLPHILFCFEQVFPSRKGTGQQTSNFVCQKVDRLYKVKGHLSSDLYSLLERSWDMLQKSGLYDSQSAVSGESLGDTVRSQLSIKPNISNQNRDD